MTRAQVMATERGKPIRDKDIQHLHVVDYEDIVAGLRCRLIYIFIHDQLVRAKYSVEERHVNKNLYLDDFNTLSSALARKYGKPAGENTLWSDELYKNDSSQWGVAVAGGHMSKYTTYDLPATRITASLTGDNFEVSVEVEYVSKALESLEDNAKADEDKDKL